MRQLTGAEMHDVYDVARLANDLVEGYDYLLSVVQAAEPHALADVAALREEASALRAENERLHSRVAELEGAAANWALVEAMPKGARLQRGPGCGGGLAVASRRGLSAPLDDLCVLDGGGWRNEREGGGIRRGAVWP